MINQFLPMAAHRSLTTEELAAVLAMRPQSLRKRFSQTGEYFGIRPVKMPNGRLFWPCDTVEQLSKGGAK
ncbi:MAG: DNA-binding protein [Glaciimonas sp.]|nr:DNA-binding protein [Glaciimonas sp.]